VLPIPLRDDNPTHRTAVVTFLLIVVNVVVYFALQPTPLVSDSFERAEFTLRYAAVPEEITSGQPLDEIEVARLYGPRTADAMCPASPPGVLSERERCFPDKRVWVAVVVSMFLHGSLLHLGSNMLYLWIFGNNVEDRLGRLRYLLFYLAAGIVATLAHVLTGPNDLTPLVGASGAIAGVMGAYLVWFPWVRIRSLVLVFLVPVPAWFLLGAWFLAQFLLPQSGVAWAAHAGGFAFGMLAGWVIGPPRRPVRLVGWDPLAWPPPPGPR
jgi:membrane associated rhomboid family serine protease